MMCCTAAGWPGPAFAPQAGLRTVGPLVLDMTAAAAAPETPNAQKPPHRIITFTIAQLHPAVTINNYSPK